MRAWVIADGFGFENLRILLNRGRRRAEASHRKHHVKHAAGRWSLLPDRRNAASKRTEIACPKLLR